MGREKELIPFYALLISKARYEQMSFMLLGLGNAHGRCVVLKTVVLGIVILMGIVILKKVKIFMLSYVTNYSGVKKLVEKN